MPSPSPTSDQPLDFPCCSGEPSDGHAFPPLAGLRRDEITRTILNLCARTEDITRDRTGPDAPWRLKLRGKRITDARMLSNIEIALTTLEAAGLIKWYDIRPGSFSTQYPLDTAAGRSTLRIWDSGVLAGDGS